MTPNDIICAVRDVDAEESLVALLDVIEALGLNEKVSQGLLEKWVDNPGLNERTAHME